MASGTRAAMLSTAAQLDQRGENPRLIERWRFTTGVAISVTLSSFEYSSESLSNSEIKIIHGLARREPCCTAATPVRSSLNHIEGLTLLPETL
jgi:hypothetical protein